MTTYRVLYLSDPPIRTQICREYGCRKEKFHFTHRVRVFTGPTMILQEIVHLWYRDKVLLVWWGLSVQIMILPPLFLQQ